MTLPRDGELGESLLAIASPGIMIDHRLITVGDEHALLPQEIRAFERRAVQVRRASGAARIVARTLLQRLGHGAVALPKTPAGDPLWPAGILGSLAHDNRVAIAAVASGEKLAGIGIDIEPAEPLPPDLVDVVTTPRERTTIDGDPYGGRLFFVAKEAVYKAIYPLEQTFLNHHDVEIDLVNRLATLRNGRVVNLRFCISTHLVALAFFAGGSG